MMNPNTYNYTIYFPEKPYAPILDLVRAKYQNETLSISGEETRWKQILISFEEESSIKFTPLEREKPGDQFSKIILGTHNWVKKVNTSNATLKEQALKQIPETQLIIGIRAVADDPIDFLLDIVQVLNGYLFDGLHLYDKHGGYI